MSYVQITGLVTNDGELALNPLYVTEEGPMERYALNSWTSIAWVENLDKGGTLLSRTPIVIEPICAHPASDNTTVDPVFVLRGSINLFEETSTVRIIVAEKIVHEIQAEPSPPIIEVDWGEAIKMTSNQTRINWNAHYKDPKALAYSISIRPKADETVRTQLTPWMRENEALISLENLPGGDVELVLTCSDGFRNVENISPVFNLPDPGCYACIYSPSDGTKVLSSMPVRLWGGGFYLDWHGHRESQCLVWNSSQQGNLGEGADLSILLKPGEHIISLTAGSGDKANSAKITLFVEE